MCNASSHAANRVVIRPWVLLGPNRAPDVVWSQPSCSHSTLPWLWDGGSRHELSVRYPSHEQTLPRYLASACRARRAPHEAQGTVTGSTLLPLGAVELLHRLTLIKDTPGPHAWSPCSPGNGTQRKPRRIRALHQHWASKQFRRIYFKPR